MCLSTGVIQQITTEDETRSSTPRQQRQRDDYGVPEAHKRLSHRSNPVGDYQQWSAALDEGAGEEHMEDAPVAAPSPADTLAQRMTREEIKKMSD